MSYPISKLRNTLDVFLASVASVCFGLSFGHNYGADNQLVYMLGSLRLLDPSILQRDWFVTQTTQYHPTFKYLAAGLIAVDPRGWAIGIAHTAVVAAGALCMYALLRALCGPKRALPAFLMMLALAFQTRTDGATATYVFDKFFQPSTLASLGLLGAAAFFARGQWLASGLCAALSGLFHANYLVLLVMALLIAHLAMGREGLGPRLLLQLLVPSAVVLLFLPVLLGAANAPNQAAAQEILFKIRAPHHYDAIKHKGEFQSAVAWLLLGGAGALCLATRGAAPLRRVGALIAGLSAVIWGGLVLSTLFQLPKATQLFSWRLLPHSILLLQAVACAGAVTVMTEPRRARNVPNIALALVFGGVGSLCLLNAGRDDRTLAAIVLAISAAPLLVFLAHTGMEMLAPTAGGVRFGRWLRRAAVPVALLASLAIVVPVAVRQLKEYSARSNLVRGQGQDEQTLYAWMRERSPKDALFLTPPRMDTLRFWGQRAIVVDWKANAMMPGEIPEWFKRIKDVTGRSTIKGRSDLDAYEQMDEKRLQLLRSRYRVDYVVVRRDRERELGNHPVAFSNGRYVVLDVRAGI
ncbi:uncharacterized protein CMC5_012630 [Chondromyces crocatus]|uniref:DUF6798 domain-containing protein n=1 Tax=Chondromyces crocatus TaxID=52 RepID=A0A0K1E991_CHOCO|nr:uncharacterized protein CMC5_012630 [Chondromyces crocatus]